MRIIELQTIRTAIRQAGFGFRRQRKTETEQEYYREWDKAALKLYRALEAQRND